MNAAIPFADRRAAGEQLAARLAGSRPEADLVVLGLPRGGVPVAAPVAAALGAPLDVIVVRKLGCPWQPELGFGAVGEGGDRVLNLPLVAELGLTAQDIERVTQREIDELARRLARYRGGRPAISLEGVTAVIVDDGVATGFTARAALHSARERGASRLVLATPVASPAALEDLAELTDQLVHLFAPARLQSIGRYYRDFSQTSDAEVTELLAQHAAGS